MCLKHRSLPARCRSSHRGLQGNQREAAGSLSCRLEQKSPLPGTTADWNLKSKAFNPQLLRPEGAHASRQPLWHTMTTDSCFLAGLGVILEGQTNLRALDSYAPGNSITHQSTSSTWPENTMPSRAHTGVA